MSKQPVPSRNTQAFFFQAGVSFAVALCAMVIAVIYLPLDPWIRAFLGLGVIFLTSSAFTLAKCVRDAHEADAVVARLDQARVEAILADHDPFKSLT